MIEGRLDSGRMKRTGIARISNPWFALGMLTVIYVFNYMDRYLIAGLAEPIRRDLQLSDIFLGVLMGPAFALLYSIASLPIAQLADKRSRIKILVAGCIVWSIFTMLSGLAPNGWVLAAMRVGVGIGEAAFVAPAYSLLADRFPPRRRGVAFAVLALGISLGQIGGYAVGPAIAATEGWRSAFLWIGCLGAIAAVLAWMFVAEPERGGNARHDVVTDGGSQLGLWRTAGQLWSDPAYRFMNLGLALGTFSGLGFSMWAPSLFVRRFSVPLVDATALFGSAFGLSSVFGLLFFGFMSDRLVVRDRRWPLRLGAAALLSATVFITAVTVSPDMNAARMLAVPCGLLGGGWPIGVMTSLQLVLKDANRASGTAIFTLANTLLGVLAGPFAVGWLSDRLGGDADALQTALLFVVAAGVPGAMLLYLGSRVLLNAVQDDR